MKVVLVSLAVAALCAGGTLGAAEFLAKSQGEGIRLAIYQGGVAGGVIGLSGLPFVLILSRLKLSASNDSMFWMWWGLGLMSRLVLLGLASMALNAVCNPQYRNAASMTMIALYLIGMFSEVAWLASVLLKNEAQPAYKKA